MESIGRSPPGLPFLYIRRTSRCVGVLWPGALGIALMSFTETIAAGRAFAAQGEPPLKPNRELLATGLANAGGAFLGSMPRAAGLPRLP